jgi:phytoene dehydrogenase-like protein
VSGPVVVIGAGVGGLAAATALARAGREVTLFEARPTGGGLASAVNVDGLRYDGGPYVLLDRPGLTWALERLNINVDALNLMPLDPVYEVSRPDAATVVFHRDAATTAEQIDKDWPGAGPKYERMVQRATSRYHALEPLLRSPDPRAAMMRHPGAWSAIPFLMRSLEQVMRAEDLPEPVVDALTIFTHVAALTRAEAASTMALVPALVHHAGAWRPEHGIAAIPEAMEDAARGAGVDIQYGTPVEQITTSAGRVTGVVTNGERIATHTVVSDVGLATYLSLLDEMPHSMGKLRHWPLQSPGVCAYLTIRPREPHPTHRLQFRLPGGGETCRLLVAPAADENGLIRARLIVPMRHADAEDLDGDAQHAFLEQVVAEPWWRDNFTDVEVHASRTPNDWGQEFSLYGNAMNPSMTAKLMRSGRLQQRSRVEGLFITGSATHPGQWVSFCAISGVLAAQAVIDT